MDIIQFRIDVNKIDKNRIIPREYTNKANEPVTAKEYSFTFVPLREAKVIKATDSYVMTKVGILTEDVTKEERESGVKGVIIGEGIVFSKPGAKKGYPKPGEDGNPNIDDIPF